MFCCRKVPLDDSENGNGNGNGNSSGSNGNGNGNGSVSGNGSGSNGSEAVHSADTWRSNEEEIMRIAAIDLDYTPNTYQFPQNLVDAEGIAHFGMESITTYYRNHYHIELT